MAERPGDPSGAAIARRTFFVLGSIGLVVAALYWGQRIFVPLALAVLLTLLLSPVVSALERRGLKRLFAVLSVTGVAFVLIGLAAWAVAAQLTNLLADLPQHEADIRARIAQLRGSEKRSPLKTLQKLVDEINAGAQPAESAPAAGSVVRVEPAKPTLFSQLQPVLLRVVRVSSAALAVLLLVITLLLYREDTRNRLIRLAGRGRMTITTRALDEAGRRIGGYLLGHASVNASFGAAIALGLALLDVPYPFLWGMLTAAFRFVPSVGIWLVAPLPAALAWIGGAGLFAPTRVLGLYLVLELITTNVVEPRVLGKSVGLATVPLLLMVTLWTSLWGIVGLVLATPVTVCLAVLGRHVRQLRFLALLLAKESALRPAARYYQRLLARDRFEAEAIVQEYLAKHTLEALFDRVLIPAFVLLRRGRQQAQLRPEDEEFILGTTREIVDGLEVSLGIDADPEASEPLEVLGVPAADGADELSLAMLRILIQQVEPRIAVQAASGNRSGPPPAAIFVAAMGPGGLTEARYLCRRLRQQYRGVKIVVGRWGRRRNLQKARARLISAGADRIAATLREARACVVHLVRPRPSATELLHKEQA